MNQKIKKTPDELNKTTSKVTLKSTFIAFVRSIKSFLIKILSVKEGTDVGGTIDEVKKSIVFKGPSVWILIFSIFIASIGLNVNSIAVIIGAMLISPLMGPIIGIGLSIGTNNLKLLRKSFKNFAIMVVISIVTSFIYFYFSPLHEAQSELLSRTKPTLLDVFVGFFGGMAGIIAASRDEKTNVIPGVAIATALMPPLCTAGYGLATFNLEFFLGAFYLFLLNSVFICLSTMLVVRYLRFPLASFIDEIREKQVKRWIMIFTLILIVPSGFIFWNIIQESLFKSKVESFVTQYINFENTEIISKKINYNDSLSVVEVFLIGEIIPENRIKELNVQMQNYGLENTKLRVNQAKDESTIIAGKLSQEVRAGIIEDLYRKNEELITSKDEQIYFLEQQLLSYKTSDINYIDLKNELQAIYEDMEYFSYAKMLSGNFISKPDTVFTFLVKWNNQMNKKDRISLNNKLKKHLEARLKLKTVKVIPIETVH